MFTLCVGFTEKATRASWVCRFKESMPRSWPDKRVGSYGEVCTGLWRECPQALLSLTSIPYVIHHLEEEIKQLAHLKCPLCFPCKHSKIYQQQK